MDIDELRHEVVDARWARDYARSIVEAVQVPLLVLDAGLHVLSANAAYYGAFREVPSQIEGHGFFELGAGRVGHARSCTGPWAASSATRGASRGWSWSGTFPEPGAGPPRSPAARCPRRHGEPMVLLAIEDVTERRQETAACRAAGPGRRECAMTSQARATAAPPRGAAPPALLLAFPRPGNRPPQSRPIPRGGFLLGRGEAVFDEPFDDPAMAPRHAEVRLQGKQVVVSDLGSGAGTRLNGVAAARVARARGG